MAFGSILGSFSDNIRFNSQITRYFKLAGAECRQERLAKKTDVKAHKMAEKVSRFIWFQVN